MKFWLHLFPHFPQFFASLWRMMETFLRHDIMMGHCLWLQGFCTSKALFTLEFYKLFCEWSLSKCTIWQALQKCTRVSSHQNEEQFLKYVTVLSNCKIRTFIQKEQILANAPGGAFKKVPYQINLTVKMVHWKENWQSWLADKNWWAFGNLFWDL